MHYCYVALPSDPPSVIGRRSTFYISTFGIDDCQSVEIEFRWEVLRADGQAETYKLVDETYHYGRYEKYTDII